jgi:hypothetical protein
VTCRVIAALVDSGAPEPPGWIEAVRIGEIAS